MLYILVRFIILQAKTRHWLKKKYTCIPPCTFNTHLFPLWFETRSITHKYTFNTCTTRWIIPITSHLKCLLILCNTLKSSCYHVLCTWSSLWFVGPWHTHSFPKCSWRSSQISFAIFHILDATSYFFVHGIVKLSMDHRVISLPKYV